jgi:hypothetical protein
MRKLHVFLFILTITLAVLITLALIAWYFSATAPSYYGSSWMGQMWGNHLGASGNYGGMGGMMGDGYYGNGNGTPTTSYLWIIPVALIGIVAVAIIGIGFYLYFPELRYIRPKGSCNTHGTQTVSNIVKDNPVPVGSTASLDTSVPNIADTLPTVTSDVPTAPNNCEVLLKTMTPEEKKVIGVLINHKGKYLQKYVVKESGLSRLKTHRIVARFAQRGIVTVNEFGNTNEIILSDWITSANNAQL